jgi:hypothetical protein
MISQRPSAGGLNNTAGCSRTPGQTALDPEPDRVTTLDELLKYAREQSRLPSTHTME